MLKAPDSTCQVARRMASGSLQGSPSEEPGVSLGLFGPVGSRLRRQVCRVPSVMGRSCPMDSCAWLLERSSLARMVPVHIPRVNPFGMELVYFTPGFA